MICVVWTNLHEAGDAHDGLVSLVKNLPPCESAAGRSSVSDLLRQEVGQICNSPVCFRQLSVEEAGGDVVLQ